MTILNWIYMKMFSFFNKLTTANADKVVHISKFAEKEYYKDRGFVKIKGKFYNWKQLVKAGFFVDDRGILRHKNELKL